jgi:predicted ATPase
MPYHAFIPLLRALLQVDDHDTPQVQRQQIWTQLLVTARPGFRHTWDDLTYFHRLTVEGLAAAHTDALIRHYFQPHDASLALKALIRDRTDGNPFFVEELLRALEDQELLTL